MSLVSINNLSLAQHSEAWNRGKPLTDPYVSALLDSPQVLIAEEEKIIVEETRGNQVVMEER